MQAVCFLFFMMAVVPDMSASHKCRLSNSVEPLTHSYSLPCDYILVQSLLSVIIPFCLVTKDSPPNHKFRDEK